MSESDRISVLEEKLAFQQEELTQLSEALVMQHKLTMALEGEVAALKSALLRMSDDAGGEILGAYGGDDPVPSSG